MDRNKIIIGGLVALGLAGVVGSALVPYLIAKNTSTPQVEARQNYSTLENKTYESK
jgi:hypothetical protein